MLSNTIRKIILFTLLGMGILQASVISLTSGESRTDFIKQGKEHFYKISGLSGQTLNSVLNELSSDADIYVRVSKKPTANIYDCSSKKALTTSDMCSVTLNSDADVYIRVYGYRSASYTLTVRMNNAKLLFASGFEDGVYIDPVPVVDYEDYAYIRGTDNVTGFSWPIDILGSTESGLHHIGDDNLQAVYAELQTTIGYDGKSTKTLYNIEHYEHKGYTQYPYEILNIIEGRKDLYVRYRMKIDSNMLGNPNTWRALFEYKTKDYKDPGEGGTGFRLISYIYTDQDGNPSWHFQGDKDSRNPIWECDSLSPTPECNNTNVPVILNKWFTTEYYWHWSEGDDGLATWKINGKIVGQHHGATTRGSNPLDFIMLTQIYGDNNPKYQWIDDIEIWDSVPDKPYYFSDLNDSSVIILTSGESIIDPIEQGEESFYKISGLSGQTFEIFLNELSADADIYVLIGEKPTRSIYDCKSTKGSTTSDSCSVTLSTNEDIYIMVYGYKEANYTLTATTLANLTISNIHVINIAKNNAKIVWDVSKYSTGQVEYGETTAYGHFNTKETSFDYNHHEQALKNLKAGTTYHYRVISEDAQGNRSVSNDYMFTTLPKNHPKKYQY